jgi:hypothetical protein
MSDRICFVIAPIGEADSEPRKRSDQVLKHIIIPATSDCGYKAIRADQISEPGMITSQVIQHVVEDPLVVADLTGRNPNVFYELAIRHAIRKPLIQLIQKSEQIPFDVAGTRTIQVDHRDLDSVVSAKQEIVAQIRALEGNPDKLETPISVSLDLQALRQSGNPEERSRADMLSALNDLRANFMVLGQRVEYSLDKTAGLVKHLESAIENVLQNYFSKLDVIVSEPENQNLSRYLSNLSQTASESSIESGGAVLSKSVKGKLYPHPK